VAFLAVAEDPQEAEHYQAARHTEASVIVVAAMVRQEQFVLSGGREDLSLTMLDNSINIYTINILNGRIRWRN